ncbi:MAG: Uma2 family endonuclease [Ktedonobacteraceae bacterium]|nr:Uma2 family endonuclease [Ktedonobacteraceae bacterium]
MNTTPYDAMITTADTVQGPGQGNWTYNDYTAMPDDEKRYQIVDGVLFMSPSPDTRHQDTVGAIFAYLREYALRNKLGKVYIAPLDVELNPKTVVQPDVLLILHAHLERIAAKRIIGAPDLVVEVSSPGTTGFDRRQKQDAYAHAGVPEYWIVNPASHTVELLIVENTAYRSLGIFQGQQTLPSTIVPGFSVPVEQFFV